MGIAHAHEQAPLGQGKGWWWGGHSWRKMVGEQVVGGVGEGGDEFQSI
jgi:hypothetical protein